MQSVHDAMLTWRFGNGKLALKNYKTFVVIFVRISLYHL